MAKNWVAILAKRGTERRDPEAETQGLASLTGAADKALTDAKSEATRTARRGVSSPERQKGNR
ncbi:MAG: hypothetical protein LBH85_07645, partial [Treponema sp.]|nr:hypothetical protein [Treponema sp.]